jgi:hypothetical protein
VQSSSQLPNPAGGEAAEVNLLQRAPFRTIAKRLTLP